ncbi:hypothetical protein M569_06105 [Genlisea aurea]|uniref:Enoyl reductase (ER) domain-containing protein n=1 Tax=Genlisea aurea TaxID=192259 RepID=S8E878_9LAMI|nr:hypothetical protein M569_06105 [Genlisea aurea]
MSAILMNAFVYDGSRRLKQVRVGVPKIVSDEVLIKVEAASLNPVDWKAYALKALLRRFVAADSPLIPATDVAGEVVDVGAAVEKFRAGDKVVAHLNFKGGGLSEYAVAKEALTALRPEGVSAVQACGLPIAGETAYVALTKSAGIALDGSGPRKNILVTAASGGVGQYAVQLAKIGNHHVTATCGSRNLDLVKSLGADEVVDYRSPEGAALRSPSGKTYDAVIHCAAAVPWSIFERNLNDAGGIVVDLTPGPAAWLTYALKKLTSAKKRIVPMILFPKDDRELKILLTLMAEGKLKTIVDSIHPLDNAEEAWRKGIDGHATGKIIVQP